MELFLLDTFQIEMFEYQMLLKFLLQSSSMIYKSSKK